jgi:hypothetical protein
MGMFTLLQQVTNLEQQSKQLLHLLVQVSKLVELEQRHVQATN